MQLIMNLVNNAKTIPTPTLSFPRPPGADPPSAEKRESSHITRKFLDVRIKFNNNRDKAFYFCHKAHGRFSYSLRLVHWIPAKSLGMTNFFYIPGNSFPSSP